MANFEKIPAGLVTGLNKMREVASDIYHQYIPIISQDTNISDLANPILNMPNIANEFMSVLVNRIVYTAFVTKYFNSPLKILEGDEIPLGYEGQEIYVNPAKGRQFNVNDFAGLLYKYEADVKVQYVAVNSDLQYPVTVSRHKLKQAFVSWGDLDRFIGELTNSLYNGAFIDEFRLTKGIISSAYQKNSAQIQVVPQLTSKAQADEFITQARSLVLNMALPSTKYNAWSKVGGEGKPITTWSELDDIVFIIRNDLLAYLDVNVLAVTFNMDKASLLGRIIAVDNFDVYDDDGNLVFDGSNIIGFVGDRRFFRIKRQDMYLDEFYNANNRTWQYYLNLTKMYNYSLFANGVILATAMPNIPTTGLSVSSETVNVDVGKSTTVQVTRTPINSTTPITLEYIDGEGNVEAKYNDLTSMVILTGKAAGSFTITLTADTISTTISGEVQTPVAGASTMSVRKTKTK